MLVEVVMVVPTLIKGLLPPPIYLSIEYAPIPLLSIVAIDPVGLPRWRLTKRQLGSRINYLQYVNPHCGE
jgi:hypothetical protein